MGSATASKKMDLVVILGIIGNVLATVGVVLANKYIYVHDNFKFMITLSFFHFVFTSIGTHVLLRFKFFEYKPAPISGVLPVALGSLGSVAFMNLNLAFNSVGFYQISKLMCIPVTLVLQYYMFGDRVSRTIQYSLGVILVGVGIATFSDVELNFIGSVFAAFAVIFTTLGQIFTHSKPKELGLDSMQLLHHASPLIALGMLLLIPVGLFVPGFDQIVGPGSLFEYEWSAHTVSWILLTCILAFGVNVTNYLVIARTSPVTYQVVGHLKTCLILVLGFVVFKYPVVWRNLSGITLAMVGMIWYTEVKRTEGSAPKPAQPVQPAYSRVANNDEDIEMGGPKR